MRQSHFFPSKQRIWPTKWPKPAPKEILSLANVEKWGIIRNGNEGDGGTGRIFHHYCHNSRNLEERERRNKSKEANAANAGQKEEIDEEWQNGEMTSNFGTTVSVVKIRKEESLYRKVRKYF